MVENDKSDIKILVIDDREDNLSSIEAILEKDNYTIVKATSGRAALKVLLHEHNFSLILMDVQMPDINGLETANIIYQREKLKNIPIIFITAENQDEDLIFRGYRMGGVDYIYKPINPELLRVKVGIFEELYRKNHQLLANEKKLLASNKSLQKEIEDRKTSEQKVNSLNSQLLENNCHLKSVNEELDRFAFIASHDLQEPLRKIMVFSDKILKTGTIDDASAKYFQKIISSSGRMKTLINDLLEFSRQSVNNLDFKRMDLRVLVNEAIQELDLEIENSGAKIQIDTLPTVMVIPSLMRQLFYNLVINALKFKKNSEVPVITIRSKDMDKQINALKSTKPAGKNYTITVTDKGIGFDPKYSEDIFMVFKRLHSFHEYEGSGMGLSICKKIMEKHNGSISAEGVLGKGSTFTITLPVKEL